MSKIKILFVAANPAGTPALKLDEEIRQITAKIRAAEFRDSLEVRSAWAARPDDLMQHLMEFKPHIVHFSGHGGQGGELYFLDDAGNPKPVAVPAIKSLFRTLKDNVKLVVFNACFAKTQAEAVVESIDCAVGMNTEVSDEAAIAFAGSFYRALGFGRSIQDAFDLGVTSILFDASNEAATPEIVTRAGVDASTLYLLSNSAVNDNPGGELADGILADLESLLSAEFELLLAYLNVEQNKLPGKGEPLATRAAALVEWARKTKNLSKLRTDLSRFRPR